MDNNLHISDIYPVTLSKTITLKVSNIEKQDGTPAGYSFTVEDGSGLIINFDQFISVDPLHFQKIILYATVGLLRCRRIVDQDPLINGCIGLLPPGSQVLEYYIIDVYYKLMEHMCKPLKHVNVKVKWPEKEE